MRKDTCEDALKMPMTFLKKKGYLRQTDTLISGSLYWSCGGKLTGSVKISVSTFLNETCVRVQYTNTNRLTGKKENLNYKIQLTTTSPYFGGIRYWFICPLSINGIPCNRNVGVLYLIGRYFGCRHCHDLAYDSQYDKVPTRLGIIGKIIDLEAKIDEAEAKIRIRQWKGGPTKRYANILKKKRRLHSIVS